MAITILNCATMTPWFPHWKVGTLCIIIETDTGLVLLDTGLGLHDYEKPSRLVRLLRVYFGIRIDPDLSAVRQLARLGYKREDVRDIILTHLHFDHAGGLPDFPHARIHAHRREYEAMQHPRRWLELAYDRNDFKHNPNWVLYERATTQWLGLDAIQLPFTPEIYLVPLFGHTRGHCGVAIQDRNGWLFQCADALPTNVKVGLVPVWLERLVLGPHIPQLQALAKSNPGVQLLSGHMWLKFFDISNKQGKNS